MKMMMMMMSTSTFLYCIAIVFIVLLPRALHLQQQQQQHINEKLGEEKNKWLYKNILHEEEEENDVSNQNQNHIKIFTELPNIFKCTNNNNSFIRQRRRTHSHNHHHSHRSHNSHRMEYTAATSNKLSEKLQISSTTLRMIGPYFESTNQTSQIIKIRFGNDVIFDCPVVLLQGRTVSWLRRKNGSVQLLTVGNQTYSNDARLRLLFRYPNNWRLGIMKVNQQDEGEYQCQLSTHPPKSLIFHLRVIAPVVQILDDNDYVITERHYKVDSSLHLTCKALNQDKIIDHVTWYKGDDILPGNDSRIKIKHSKNHSNNKEAIGFLSIHSVRKDDSGNYSCLSSNGDLAIVLVHVLNEKHPEAVQYENSTIVLRPYLMSSILNIIIIFIYFIITTTTTVLAL